MATLGIIASQMTVQKTAVPTIVSGSSTGTGKATLISWVVRNNATTATILSDVGITPPTTNKGTIAYNATVNCSYSDPLSFTDPPTSGLIYATAQASGFEVSDVASYYYEPA